MSGISRIVALLEAFAPCPPEGFSPAEVAARSDIALSTAYRLLADMEAGGHVCRDMARRLHPNFSFERRIAGDAVDPARLATACADLSDALRTETEVILLRRHNLRWHMTRQHPEQAIRLRATPGYIRATYELDSISRLALAHLPLEEIEASWDLAAFHKVGVSGRRIPWAEARRHRRRRSVRGRARPDGQRQRRAALPRGAGGPGRPPRLPAHRCGGGDAPGRPERTRGARWARAGRTRDRLRAPAEPDTEDGAGQQAI